MKNITAPPGYRVYEYMLVLSPHEELRNMIMHIKQEFNEAYQASAALYSKPYITLVSFTQYGLAEERIISKLKKIAMGFTPAKIELKDYGSFPAHTLYIQVTSKTPIQNLVKQIRTETQRLMKLNSEQTPHFITEPYIPIARKLQPWQYEKGWLAYSHKNFTGRFMADAMLLLKRPAGEKRYEIAARFDFENMPVNTRQGELF